VGYHVTSGDVLTFWETEEHFRYVGHSTIPKCLNHGSFFFTCRHYFRDLSFDMRLLAIHHEVDPYHKEVIVYEIENPFNNLEFEETILDQNYGNYIRVYP